MESTGRPSTGKLRRMTGTVAGWFARHDLNSDGPWNLAKADRHLAMLFSQVPVGLAELDLTGQIIQVNSRFANLIDRPAQAASGVALREFIAEEDRHAYDRAFGQLSSLDEPRVEEVRLLSAGGRETWVQLAILLIRDSRRRASCAAAIAFEITDRKRAEARAAESERRFREVADAAPVFIWISGTDHTRHHTWVNTPWLEFRGRPIEKELGGGWIEGVHAEDVAICMRAYTGAFSRKGPFSVEYRLQRWDGEYRWVLDRGAPMHDERGGVIGYIGSCIDITDRKVAEAEREAVLAAERAARTEAERVNQLKDEFLSTLSHELRTPLNAVLGWVHLLKTSVGNSVELARGLSVIERNARLQSRMVDDLLDLRRIIAGTMHLDLTPLHVSHVLDVAIESLQPTFAAKGVCVRKIYDPRAGQVLGDPHRLQQVLWNLLSNAIKFSYPGGTVAIEVRRVLNHVKIVIRDDGHGIEPHFLPFVFERFRQSDSSTHRAHGGLGIGLALVKSLIELHGGTVRAASAGEGQGATFTVMLPTIARSVASPREPAEVARGLNVETDKKVGVSQL